MTTKAKPAPKTLILLGKRWKLCRGLSEESGSIWYQRGIFYLQHVDGFWWPWHRSFPLGKKYRKPEVAVGAILRQLRKQSLRTTGYRIHLGDPE